MNGNILAIMKNEIRRYFISPLAWVYIVFFVILNGAMTFYFGNFFDKGEANLLSMFAFHPYLYLLLIPAISMRLWSEEFKQDTIVLLLSLPVKIWQVVVAKYLAAVFFCIVSLVLTIPFWISVNLLGNPDNLVIFVGYVASMILGASFLAIGSMCSAMTKNQVVSFVISLFICLVFMLTGFEIVLDVFRNWFGDDVIDVIASFSFYSRFSNMIGGFISLSDFVYFISAILFFLFVNVVLVSLKSFDVSKFVRAKYRGINKLLFFVSVFLLFITVNIISYNQFSAIGVDFTESGKYSLSEKSKDIIGNIKNPIEARFYYSKILGKRNAKYRAYYDKVRFLLNNIASKSKGKFTYKIYDVLPISENEDRAIANAIQPVPMADLSQNAFFGISFSNDLDDKQVIPYLHFDRMSMLEYDVLKAIYLLNGYQKKKIGLVTELPMEQKVDEGSARANWQILDEIAEFYEVVNISKDSKIASDIELLMIVHPEEMGGDLLKEINAYIKNGGKALILSDVAMESTYQFAPVQEKLKASNVNVILNELGIHYLDKFVVGDLDNSIIVDASTNYSSNSVFTNDVLQILFKSNNFNNDDGIFENINNIFVSSIGAFIKTKNLGYEVRPLIASSKNSMIMPSKVVIDGMNPAKILKHFKSQNTEMVTAIRVSGENGMDVIAVGDVDMIYDDFYSDKEMFYGVPYFAQKTDNSFFVMNAIDSLIGIVGMAGARARKIDERAFEIVDKIRIESNQKYKIKEQELIVRLEDSKKKLWQLWNGLGNRTSYNENEKKQISDMKDQILEVRDELRVVKYDLVKDIDKLEAKLKFYNIYLIPILIVLFFLIVMVRRVWLNSQKQMKIVFDKSLTSYVIAIIALIIVAKFSFVAKSGLIIEDYEGKAVFASLMDKINDVEVIRIADSSGKAEIIKTSRGWAVKGREHMRFNVVAFNNFLSEMVNSRYLEKKTNNSKKFGYFNLLSIENNESKAHRISIVGHDGKMMFDILIGDMGVDIGRGGKGAYIRKSGEFQTWLIEGDFREVSANIDDWVI